MPPDAIAAARPMPLLRPVPQQPYPLPLHPSQPPNPPPPRTSQAPQRLPLNPQEDDAANLQRIASAEGGNSSNPLQPEPPRVAAARPSPKEADWGPGRNAFRFRPGGFPPLSTGESGLPSHTKDKPQDPPAPQPTPNTPPIKNFKSPLQNPNACAILYTNTRSPHPPRRKGNKSPQPQGQAAPAPCPGGRAESAGAERARPWGEGGRPERSDGL